jgi:hypothetical protein
MLTCETQRIAQNIDYTSADMNSAKLPPINTDLNDEYSDSYDDYDYSDSTIVDYSNSKLEFVPQLEGGKLYISYNSYYVLMLFYLSYYSFET